jgi:hypothetical protein
MIQGGDDTPERLFWRWQTRANELTIDQLRVIRDWALLRFPGSIDLLELDIWKLQGVA